MGVLFQVIATLLLSFSCMNMGIMIVWPSSTVLLFKSQNTTLHRPMTDTEVALFGSLPAIGSLVSHLVSGLILDRLGRKRTVLLTSLVFVTGWSIIAVTDRVEAILLGMLVHGLGWPFFLQATIYISEISQNSIRGTLTAGPYQSCSFGYLMSYFLGGALGYHAMVYTCLSLAVAGVLLIVVLKESPVTLMAKGREEEAVESIAFYHHVKPTCKEVITEISNIRRSFKSDAEEVQSLTQLDRTKEPELEAKKTSCWHIFKTDPITRSQFYLVLVLKASYVCQGLPIVQVYAEPIFAEAIGDYISPNLCSVILGVVALVSGIVAGYMTDVIGRRPLILYASISAGVCCAVLGTHIVTEWLPKWIVPLFIYLYAISYSFGAGTIPFVYSSEIFLPEVKSILLALTVEWSCICYFAIFFTFSLLIPSFGLAPMFYFFSTICFAGFVYFFHFLPETKGLPVYAIQEVFKNILENKRIKI